MNYLGSKKKLLDFIKNNVINVMKDWKPNYKSQKIIFCDLFAGTGSVGSSFSNIFSEIIFNDIQFYSSQRIKVMANLAKRKKKELFFKKYIEHQLDKMNNLKNVKGYFYKNYSPSNLDDYNRKYFTTENAMKIDACIKYIENMSSVTSLEKEIKNYLIISVMEAADKVANITGVYEAYLKQFKTCAKKELVLKKLVTNISPLPKTKIYNMDASILINKIAGDILYLDPPYNSRQYSSNYHILETLSKLDNPEIKGKTGIRKDSFKSNFSSKNNALSELDKLILNARFKYIFISYNNNGNITIEQMVKMLSKYGIIAIYKEKYKIYKSNSKTKNKENYEYLFCLKKG